MKAVIIGALVAALAAGAAFAQPASDAAPAAESAKPNNVCLWTYLIDHTTIKDRGKAILFHMRNGKNWENTLKVPCPGLNFNGFAYITRNGSICSNMQAIYVLRTHEVCLLGDFEPYAASPKMKPDNAGH